MNKQAAYLLLWLLIVPITITLIMQFIASKIAGIPVVVFLNLLILFAVGFFSVKRLPGNRVIKLTMLLAVPVTTYLFYWGESEPGFEGFNILVIGIEALVILGGGLAAIPGTREIDSERLW